MVIKIYLYQFQGSQGERSALPPKMSVPKFITFQGEGSTNENVTESTSSLAEPDNVIVGHEDNENEDDDRCFEFHQSYIYKNDDNTLAYCFVNSSLFLRTSTFLSLASCFFLFYVFNPSSIILVKQIDVDIKTLNKYDIFTSTKLMDFRCLILNKAINQNSREFFNIIF